MVEPDLASARRLRVFLDDWGKKHIEYYPWRYVSDPYCILVSEFMLHRTQAKQVIPIYLNFFSRYPDLKSFAAADPSDVIGNLKSLGLQWRIEGMVSALNELWQLYKSIPLDVNRLMAIDGIGQYIAGATVCFSLNVPLTLIDSNIVRVIGRIFGLDLSGEARRKKSIVAAISACVDQASPRNFYYGMIDLAHNICRPGKPVCSVCPLLEVPCIFGQRTIT